MNQKKDIVEKDKIVDFFKNPQNISDEDIMILEKWVSRYPYFQSAHILIAKLAKDKNSPNKDIKLNYAAIYSPNRGVLKRIILSSISEIPQLKKDKLPSDEDLNQQQATEPDEEPQAYHQLNEPISDDWKEKNKNYNQNLKDEYLIKRESFEIKEIEDKEETPVPKVNQKLVDEVLANLEKARRLKKQYLEREDDEKSDYHSGNAEKKASTNQPYQQEPDKTTAAGQKDLIDIFIENEKSLGKIQPKLNIEPHIDLAEKSTSLAEDMVSENLASILRKQGKKDKAIDIYKKLIWKFPQKRAYFATLIEELKNN